MSAYLYSIYNKYIVIYFILGYVRYTHGEILSHWYRLWLMLFISIIYKRKCACIFEFMMRRVPRLGHSSTEKNKNELTGLGGKWGYKKLQILYEQLRWIGSRINFKVRVPVHALLAFPYLYYI